MTTVANEVNPRLEAALAYAERGWWVLPLHAPNGVMGCSCDWNKRVPELPVGESKVACATAGGRIVRFGAELSQIAANNLFEDDHPHAVAGASHG